MSELYEECKEQFLKLRESIRKKLADGRLSMVEAMLLSREFVHAAIQIAEELKVPGKTKRELVIEAALQWWDEELEQIDLPGPDVIIDPIIRAAIPVVVGALVDAIIGWFNKYGWPEKRAA